MSYQQQKHAVIEATEAVKLQRLRVKLQIEQEGLKTDQLHLQKARVTYQIAGLDLQQEQIRLTGARVAVQTAQIQLQKAKDVLNFERADMILGRQKMGEQLQLKSIEVSSLREEIRHQRIMKGGGIAGYFQGGR